MNRLILASLAMQCFCIISTKLQAINSSVAPIAICVQNINVSLDPSGQAIITPEMIDAGSYDDSSSIPVSLSFSADVNDIERIVTCNDLFNPFNLELWVTDGSGATGVCYTSVLVEDKFIPTIVCPQDVTFNDCANFDTSFTGIPTGSDNCPDLEFAFFDDVEFDGCPGTINRTWTVWDFSGNSATCNQSITYVSSFSVTDIIWPADYSTTGCDIENLPPPFDQPTFTNTECTQIAINVEESKLSCNEIQRDWTVIEWCEYSATGGGIYSYTQFINTSDITPPEIIGCQNPITVCIDQSCDGAFYSPNISAIDDCSDVLFYNYNIDFYDDGTIDLSGSANQVFEYFPPGMSRVTWYVSDECQNSSFCDEIINVIDCAPPIVIANTPLIVDVGSTAGVIVDAINFDAGSYAVCGAISEFLIQNPSLDNGAFVPPVTAMPSLIFDCDDIGLQTLDFWVISDGGAAEYTTVQLQVTDVNDVCTSCSLELVCPPDVSIDCQTDFNDLTITGEPVVTSQCPPYTVSYSDDLTGYNNVCYNGIGTIVRTWVATDSDGNTAECTQLINILNINPFTENDITWPANYSGSECGNQFPFDPFQIGSFPILNGNTCSSIESYWIDTYTGDLNSGCFDIIRIWIVEDYCQSPIGTWTHTQLLTSNNFDGPVISFCDDILVCADQSDCSGFVELGFFGADDCTPDTSLSYTYSIDYFNDGVVDVTGNSNLYFDILPIGLHSALWTVTDLCGNSTSCMQNIEVVDCFGCDCPEFLNFTNPFISGEFQYFSVWDYIEATNTIENGANITYDAFNCVQLNNGFEVEIGAEFLGQIGGCQPIFSSSEAEDTEHKNINEIKDKSLEK